MNIHEYQAKELLAKFGVAVPKGIPAMSVEEAVAAARGRCRGPLAELSARGGAAADRGARGGIPQALRLVRGQFGEGGDRLRGDPGLEVHVDRPAPVLPDGRFQEGDGAGDHRMLRFAGAAQRCRDERGQRRGFEESAGRGLQAIQAPQRRGRQGFAQPRRGGGGLLLARRAQVPHRGRPPAAGAARPSAHWPAGYESTGSRPPKTHPALLLSAR